MAWLWVNNTVRWIRPTYLSPGILILILTLTLTLTRTLHLQRERRPFAAHLPCDPTTHPTPPTIKQTPQHPNTPAHGLLLLVSSSDTNPPETLHLSPGNALTSTKINAKQGQASRRQADRQAESLLYLCFPVRLPGRPPPRPQHPCRNHADRSRHCRRRSPRTRQQEIQEI